MNILKQIKDIKWRITKKEFKKIFSDKQWYNYHPEEKNALTFSEIDDDLYILINAFFVIEENLHKLAMISLSFYKLNHERLDDDISDKVFEENKIDLMSFYGKPIYENDHMPPECYMAKFVNWKTDNLTISLSLMLSKDYKSLTLSKDYLSNISTISIPPSVGIQITDIKKENKISHCIGNQVDRMKQAQQAELKEGLEKFYVPMFQETMDVSLSQAQSVFCDVFNEAKMDSENGDTLNLPRNYGDILIKEGLTNEKIKWGLDKKRDEGVKNEDIRWWWNMPDLARKIMLSIDAIEKYACFSKLKEEDNLTDDDIEKKIRKYYPVYGDPYDSSDSDDRYDPLPFELKNRVNIYIKKKLETDPEQFRKEMEESSNFNTLIRKEIKKNIL